ncbi:MAG: hypothetical protein IT442_05525 [Phycisphaeraceae bacterium]|nr:hypothetical protein [Phycisphaeraceae bacterium]
MNKRDVAFLSCRVLALYTWIHVVFRLDDLAAGVYGLFETKQISLSLTLRILFFLSASLPLILFAALGVLLWSRAARLADRMLRSSQSEAPALPVDPHTVQAIAFSAIGLFVLMQAIPTFASQMMTAVMAQRHAQTQYELLDWRWKTAVTATLIQIAVSLWLLLGARGIVKALTNLRHAGLKPTSKPS